MSLEYETQALVQYIKQFQDAVSGIRGETVEQLLAKLAAVDTLESSLVSLKPRNAPPADPVYGMIVLPDGDNWNPLEEDAPTTPSTAISTNTVLSGSDTYKYDVSVTYDSVNERFFTVYRENTTGVAGNQFDIRGRIVDSTGEYVGNAIDISTSWAGRRLRYPVVAYSSTSERYLICWEESRTSDGGSTYAYYGIIGCILDASGAGISGEFVIANVSQATQETYPAVAWDSTNNKFIVAYVRVNSASSAEIYNRTVSVAGSLLTSATLVTSTTLDGVANEVSSTGGAPSIAFNSTAENHLIVFTNAPSTGEALWGQLLTTAGAVSGTPFAIETLAGSSYAVGYSSLVYNSTGNQYLLAYMEGTSGRNTNTRLISAAGVVGSEVNIDTSTTWTGAHPRVIWNSTDGEYGIIYTIWSSGGMDPVYSRSITSANVKSTASEVESSATYNKDFPAVAWDSVNNQYLRAWAVGGAAAGPLYFDIVASLEP